MLALIVANSLWRRSTSGIWRHTSWELGILHWINDVLMAGYSSDPLYPHDSAMLRRGFALQIATDTAMKGAITTKSFAGPNLSRKASRQREEQ